ncbi:MAG: winged helix-turn-helix domain-containing protein [Candidatus Methanoperedens sp.]|nr:winged helix-turn-helix domain-containing protein [Candidatus Methanoperedens sp.]
MNDNERPNKSLRILIVILLLVLFSFAAIMPLPSKSEFQTNKPCVESESVSLQQQQFQEEKIQDQLECSSDSNKELLKLFILGIVNIDGLTMWVLGVDRRLVVLKMMHEKRMIQASDIADSTDRSLQNISYAMRELEEQGLIKCLTPGKHTWKKYIPTEKGTKVFEKLKKNNFIT